jgi:hypothetical protein
MLKDRDAVYRKALTVSGTEISGCPQTRHRWRLAMTPQRTALHQRAVEILDRDQNKPTESTRHHRKGTPTARPIVRLERAVLLTGTMSVVSVTHRPPPVTIGQPGYARRIGFSSRTSTWPFRRILWVTGRGLSADIDQITHVSREPDGMLLAKVSSLAGAQAWELRIDPAADYMIRSGKSRYYTFSNEGIQRLGRYSLPVKGVWNGGPQVYLTFDKVADRIDHGLLKSVEEMMHAPYTEGAMETRVVDDRFTPTLVVKYRADRSHGDIGTRRQPLLEPEVKTDLTAARKAAVTFLSTAKEGKNEEIARLLQVQSEATGHIEDLRTIAATGTVKLKAVHLIGAGALAITYDVPQSGDSGPGGPLLFRLARHGDTWLVDRIDTQLDASITKRIAGIIK